MLSIVLESRCVNDVFELFLTVMIKDSLYLCLRIKTNNKSIKLKMDWTEYVFLSI